MPPEAADNGTLVLFAAGGFALLMAVIGVLSARKASSSDDFLVAGRGLPLWLCTATLTATWMGAGTVIGAAGAAYESGMLGVIADPFGAALCLLLAGLFYVRVLRRMQLLTVSDFFEIRFGATAGVLSSVALFALYIGWTAVQFKAFGQVAGSLIGISPETGIVCGAIVILIYTAAGGMWAVAMTDAWQVVIVLFGLAVMLALVVVDTGGVDATIGQLTAEQLRLTPAENTGGEWLEYLRAWLIIGIGSIATQDLMQRSFAARSERVAQYAAYLASLAYLTFGMIPVLLGLIGSVTLPELDDPEMVVPELAAQHLHPVAMVVFVGALLAAVMSSADSALLAPASLLSANLIPYFRPEVSDEGRLRWARWSIPVIGCASVAVALYADNIYDLMLSSFEMPLVCLFVPFTAGIWWRGANGTGALAAMITGGALWLGCLLFAKDLPAELVGLAGAAAILVVVSKLTATADPPRPLRNRDGDEIEPRNRLGIAGLREPVGD
ncbi:MAG: sodium:solute symporter family protein [Planctomycetota bacterium]